MDKVSLIKRYLDGSFSGSKRDKRVNFRITAEQHECLNLVSHKYWPKGGISQFSSSLVSDALYNERDYLRMYVKILEKKIGEMEDSSE